MKLFVLTCVTAMSVSDVGLTSLDVRRRRVPNRIDIAEAGLRCLSVVAITFLWASAS